MPRELPKLTKEEIKKILPKVAKKLKDEEYYFDYRLMQLRTVTPPVRPIQFVDLIQPDAVMLNIFISERGEKARKKLKELGVL